MVLENLVRQQHVKRGTWLSIETPGTTSLRNCVVEAVGSSGWMLCVDLYDQTRLKVYYESVRQIDGMIISRFLEQANLTKDGLPRPAKRKGRRPKSNI
jgi:hypothetical protein